MLSDGEDGFSWAGWNKGPRYDADERSSVFTYFWVAGILIDHYRKTATRVEPVEKLIQRLERLFPPDQFADVYKIFATMLIQSDGEEAETE